MSDTPLATVAAPEANGTTEATPPAATNTFSSLSREVLYKVGNDVSNAQADMARDLIRRKVHDLTDATVAIMLSNRKLCSALIKRLYDRDNVGAVASSEIDPDSIAF